MKQETSFKRRQRRVRYRIRRESSDRVRLCIFRSNSHIHAQLIDDVKGVTLAAASTVEKDIRAKLKNKTCNQEAAKSVGTLIAERAKKANVSVVVFDRGGYAFHGRVKALAEAARAGGLKF